MSCLNKRSKHRRMKKRIIMVKLIKLSIGIVFVLSLLYLIKEGILIYKMQSNIKSETNEVETTSTMIKEELPKTQEDINNEKINYVYMNQNKYTEDVLELLEKNKEALDFVYSYPELARKQEEGSILNSELQNEHVLFLQWDFRWGWIPYGNKILALSGCGPTSLSMVIVALTGNREASPAQLARYSEEKGYYINDCGTAWKFMTDAAKHYGLKVKQLPMGEMSMKNSLDMGKLLIASMGPGDFTEKGHFLVIYGYDDNGFLINDPNSKKNSEKSWSYERLAPQIKNIWGYQKNQQAS